jgi:hypothetical protein
VFTISIHEFSLSVNSFNEPLTYEDAEAVMILLTRLLLLDPGTIQSHPEMGVGLTTKFRYGLDGSEILLQTTFREQIDKYLPDFQAAEIRVQLVDHSYRIYATLDNYLFSFMYDIDTNTLSNKFTSLASL